MAEFFAMGGYGFYVWGSYGVTALLLGLEVYFLMRSRRTILQRLRRMVRMNKQVNQ